MTNREKDIEILALRDQLTALQRQLDSQPPHLQPDDRAPGLLVVRLVELLIESITGGRNRLHLHAFTFRSSS